MVLIITEGLSESSKKSRNQFPQFTWLFSPWSASLVSKETFVFFNGSQICILPRTSYCTILENPCSSKKDKSYTLTCLYWWYNFENVICWRTTWGNTINPFWGLSFVHLNPMCLSVALTEAWLVVYLYIHVN